MAKTKQLKVDCTVCKKTVIITVPVDIVVGREYFPFEYLDVHGSPEHALMLFLDANLAIRDTKVYEDLKIAKQEGKQYESLSRMSESEILASIYNDPIKVKLYTLLIDGPKTDEALIAALKNESGFQESSFNMIMLPLIKTGIVKTAWLKSNNIECNFLIKDFLVLRVPASIVSKSVSKNNIFKEVRDLYSKQVSGTLSRYKAKMHEGTVQQIEIAKKHLKYLNDVACRDLIRELRYEPMPKKKILASSDEKIVNELIKDEIIGELSLKGEIYYALLCDIKIEKIEPRYMINTLAKKMGIKEIDADMAITYLDLLFETKYT